MQVHVSACAVGRQCSKGAAACLAQWVQVEEPLRLCVQLVPEPSLGILQGHLHISEGDALLQQRDPRALSKRTEPAVCLVPSDTRLAKDEGVAVWKWGFSRCHGLSMLQSLSEGPARPAITL